MKSRTLQLFPIGDPLSLLILSIFAAGPVLAAEVPMQVAEVHFNDNFLHTDGQAIDITRFSRGNVAVPGQYRADIYVNKIWAGRSDITLSALNGDKANVQPCFDHALLDRIGVDFGKLAPESAAMLEAGISCPQLPALIPAATAAFDFGEQRLDISIPQIAMNRSARGYVDPRYWDNGITAATLGYNANVYSSNSDGKTNTQGYLGLNAGVNVGDWRFRHNGSYSDSTATGGHYQSVQTNLQRAIVPLDSQLTIGDAFTDGSMFDSVGFRGVQLATDDRMRPDSQRGYAPIVHGIANSNALVQIRQNGNVIYETTVAPGAFEIDDLYPTGYGGDLEVVVTEADGSVHVSLIPYSAPVNSVREGVTRYSAMAGQYRNNGLHSTPWLTQATVQHGFTNMVTGYGGATLADGYAAGLGGVALNTSVGGFGVDVTYAATHLNTQADQNGMSARLSYSKLIAPTNTNLTMAAYRYSSKGYLGLQDAMAVIDADRWGAGNALDAVWHARGRLQLSLNQALPEGYGSFYASGSSQNYWNRSGNDLQYQLGYNNNFKGWSYGVSASRQFNAANASSNANGMTTATNTPGKWDTVVMFTVGIPLGSGAYQPFSSTSVQHNSSGNTSVQENLSGNLGSDNAFSYGLNAGHSSGGDAQSSNTLSVNASYMSPLARLGVNASKNGSYSQTGASMSGGMVAYDGGVAFTPSMSETSAIVEAPDASGARLANGSGLRVDPWGHALVSGLTPFARNQVEIDPKGLPLNVELKSTMQHVAPTAGAVVKVKFETENTGRSALLRLATTDDKPVPFGAEVFDADGVSVGTVAQSGRVIVRGLKADKGDLTVKWSDAITSACRVSYELPALRKEEGATFSSISTMCRPMTSNADVAVANTKPKQ
ncbi:fimbria/pilus outer membrane usher protein [Silvimonas soli]|uniref:fimbria/pilus outer membrane usher protein n=1 Tax=Silvimonas soli TaxID=2980100 RepID=UPI0024B39102|nr:fimbria/pilus outer membrane usher protein [Silvimonas soli]